MTRRPSCVTAIDVTVRMPNWRGVQQTWEARSRDGQWLYVRTEAPGTYWSVQYLPSGQVLHDAYSTLRDARTDTANGRARELLREYAARQARDMRLPAHERDEACGWLARYDAEQQQPAN